MNLLHLEDTPRDAELIRELLATELPGCTIRLVASLADFVAALAAARPDVILSDFSLPGFSGLDALAVARTHAPAVPFIFLSGTIGEERAIEVLHAGAHDYVLKDNPARLVPAITRALREAANCREREAAERRVRELADIIERATEAIVVADFAGRITHWNRGAERLFGGTAGEMIGQPVLTALALGVAGPGAEFHAALTTDSDWRGEIQGHNRQGDALVVEVSVTVLRAAAGQPTGRLWIITDITEKRKLQEQSLRAQRLESIGMLAAGIAHDLNNVLAPVSMAATLLRDKVTANSDHRLLDTLEKCAERGTGLVKQILGFARGIDDKLRLVQVKHLLHDVIDVIAPTFPKSIILAENIPNDLWPIQGHPTQIHQVLLNLCVNARDAMPHGGTLHLSAANRVLDAAAAARLEGARPGAWLVLHVADSGTGIPPDVLAHIWEPFFTTKGAGEGTGLGLSTVRGIVVDHLGFITLRTALHEGTAVQVYLPAADAPVESGAQVAAPSPHRGQNRLILFVDDEEMIRQTATAILAANGYRVLVAADGLEAARLFEAHAREIAAVITDFDMPNLNGAALIEIIRTVRPAAKILAMSGLASKSRHAPHADLFLPKPFTVAALLEAVAQVLEQPAPAS